MNILVTGLSQQIRNIENNICQVNIKQILFNGRRFEGTVWCQCDEHYYKNGRNGELKQGSALLHKSFLVFDGCLQLIE